MKFHDDVHLTSDERELLRLVERSLDRGELVNEPHPPVLHPHDNWVADASGATLAASGGVILGAALSTPTATATLVVLVCLGTMSLVGGAVAAIAPSRRWTARAGRRAGAWIWLRLRHPRLAFARGERSTGWLPRRRDGYRRT